MNILLFQTRPICYDSTRYFREAFAKAFTEAGCSVTLLDATQGFPEKEALSQKWDVVLDFSSRLPGLMSASEVYCMDRLEVPFFNFILDHPLYYHEHLSIPLKNYHVICLDQFHTDYVKIHYPHIQSVHTLFLPGVPSALQIPYEERPYELSFTGTYTSPENIRQTLNEESDGAAGIIFDLADEMSLNTAAPMEQIVAELFPGLTSSTFSKTMRMLFPADMYIKALYREKVMENLLLDHHPIHVFGSGWADFPMKNHACFHLEGELSYENAADIAAQSKFLLNVNPWFKQGAHDRVFTAMYNGAVPLTDGSIFLDSCENIALYSLEDPHSCSQVFSHYKNNPAKAASMSQKAMETARREYSYEKRAADLLSLFRSCGV